MSDDVLMPRSVRDSQSEMAEIVLPNDANPLAALLGGRLMHWIDLAGAMAAHRHARSYAVTASVDHIDFLVPVRVGDLVILRSSVNRKGNHLKVAPVVPETEEQQRRYDDAGRRREIRRAELERRRKMKR